MNPSKTLSLSLTTEPAPLPNEGKKLWRSLEELAETEAFQEMVHREFPEQASEWANPLTRRQFLTLMGASLALAGVSGCTQKSPEKIVPYVRQPEQVVPGKPLFFATAMALGSTVTGLLVESHLGRPTKIEGNPQHPASRGATDYFAQAAVLTLYDPDRSQTVRHLGKPASWDQAITELRKQIQTQTGKQGVGLRLLMPASVSPTLAAQVEELLQKFPRALCYQYEPIDQENVTEGSRQAYGEAVHTYHVFTDLDQKSPAGIKAKVILSLDADFLSTGPAHLRNTREYAAGRQVRNQDLTKAEMNRLYVVESTPSITGASADHRLRLASSQIEYFTRAIALELRKRLPEGTGKTLAEVAPGSDLAETAASWVEPLVADLVQNQGRSVILAGAPQPPVVHALVHAMNQALGNVGKTVFYTRPLESLLAQSLVRERIRTGPAELKKLTEEMAAGTVETLLILDVNAAYTAPADVNFADALLVLSKTKAFTAFLGLYEDETSCRCQWHLPEAHFLESWSDARNYDGSVTIAQPLIAPLYDGRSKHELLEVFNEGTPRPGYEIVRAYWRGQQPAKRSQAEFEQLWEKTLNDGLMPNTGRSRHQVTLKEGWSRRAQSSPEKSWAPGTLEVVFRADPTLYDGRFANNGWLQELPRPLTRLTWDNALLISPETANKLGLKKSLGWKGGEHGQMVVDVVRLSYAGREETFPVYIMPSHADDSVTVHLGNGRTRAGKVGNTDGRFNNGYRLRTSQAPWFDTGVQIEKTGEYFTLACTQGHNNMVNRNLVREAALEKLHREPDFANRPAHGHGRDVNQEKLLPTVPQDNHTKDRSQALTLYGTEDKYQGRKKWGMVIDLSACTGCGACVLACQSENNIPIVGKEEVARGREMHWLRIDRYFEGDENNPKIAHQPVPCMHCENAPCEVVCPVAATAHSHDGLNDMIYNRCVGTRYCSNNCPYKVRRFNFLQYADYATTSLKLGRNPDVTVRSRGVMEKCTFCVQRIRQAEIEAEKSQVRTEERARARARAQGLDANDPAVISRILDQLKQSKEVHLGIQDGDVVTACQGVCPAQAIVFGDINDEQSQVNQLKRSPLNYGLLTDLNTRPRTTYLAAVRNPNPRMPREQAQ